MKKIINGFCVGLGFLFLVIGAVGAVLPLLPTTPFLLLSGAFFARGSKRFHQWLTQTKLYQSHIEQVLKKKAMTRKAKVTTLTAVSCMLLIAYLLSPIWHAKVLIAAIAVFHYYYFLFRIKTIGREKEQGILFYPEAEQELD